MSSEIRRRLVGGAVAALLLVASPAARALDQQTRAQLMHAVVFLVAMQKDHGRLVPTSRGSGTIISPTGVILTNLHVIQNEQTHQPYAAIAVGFTREFDRAPEFTCLAYPSRAKYNPRFDLALIKCETTMQGGPLPAGQRFPTVPIGDSSALVPGDDIFVIGYPGIGGTTINFTAGKVSGFIGEDNKPGRDWIKTDAGIAGGNSGGAAIDERGRLVGVPTRIGDIEKRGQYQIGQINYLRPVAKAKDLIDPALAANWDPVRARAAAEPRPIIDPAGPLADNGGGGGGDDEANDDDSGSDEPQAPPPPRKRYAPTPGDDGDGDGSDDSAGPPKRRPQRADQAPMDPYGDAPRASIDGVTFQGRIVAADSGRPIAGAVVLFLKPGVRLRDVSEDNIDDALYTKGIADSSGAFASEAPLPRGKSFAVVIAAKKYRPISVDNGVVTSGNMPPSYDLGIIKLQRR